jgi:uncharacterized protein (TIGR02594 family)
MNKDLIITACHEIGLKEVPGEVNNKRILQYFNEIGHNWVQNDETAWCSAFANFVAKTAGCLYSKELNARSWLNVGKSTSNPEIGDIVVYWRESPDSWKGHVGFYFGYNESGTHIITLGGNQDNMVKFSLYPVNRLLGFRNIKK